MGEWLERFFRIVYSEVHSSPSPALTASTVVPISNLGYACKQPAGLPLALYGTIGINATNTAEGK